MDFDEAVDFLKEFPACHPKIFKRFVEWDGYTEAEGYVFLTDADVHKETCFNQLENYIKSHN